MPTRSLSAPALTLAALLAGSTTLGAVDIWVTRYDDPPPGVCLPTDCSLREAVIATQGLEPIYRIHLSAGTYDLTRAGADEDDALTGDLDIRDRVFRIEGAGANLTRIDAHGLDLVFDFRGPLLQGRLTGLQVSGGADGLGVHVDDGTLLIDHCEIRDNSGDPTAASGVLVGASGVLTVRESTIANNVSVGIQVTGGTAYIENTTFSGNPGGHLRAVLGGTVICAHCTISNPVNAVPEVAAVNGGLVQLRNSVVIGSCEENGGDVESQNGNLESPGDSCGLDQSEDQANEVNPAIGALALNFGTTRTHLPSIGSPLLGGAFDALCAEFDQRGAGRPETSCDTGAVERLYDSPPSPTPIFADGFEQGDEEAWSHD